MHDAVVIGGGITGLALAYDLTRRAPGTRVLLCEPETLGGVVRTEQIEGFTLEKGPNVLIEKPRLRAMLDELGLRPLVRYPIAEPYAQCVWADGRAHEVPKTPRKLLGSSLLSAREKMTLPYRLFAKGVLRPRGDDESIATFFSRLLDPATVSRVIDPVLKGIYGGSADRLSARSVFPDLWRAAVAGESLVGYMRARGRKAGGVRPRIFTLQGGMRALVSALADRIWASCTVVRDGVSALEPATDEGGLVVRLRSGDRIRAPSVFVTTSGPASGELVRGLDSEVSDGFSMQRYAGLVMLHFALRDRSRVPPRTFGTLFPAGTPGDLLGVMYNSELFPHLAPPGAQLVTVCIGGVDSPMPGAEDDAVWKVGEHALELLFGTGGGDRLGLQRWPRAVPQLEVGHWRSLEKVRALERRIPGLYFIGVDQGGVGVPDRLAAAHEAVDRWREAYKEGYG